MSRTFAAPQKAKAGDIPVTTFGKTGVKVGIIAQGGARMDLHPNVQAAAAYVRRVYDLGVTYFDCARMYWDGRSEEAYGIGLQGVRKERLPDEVGTTHGSGSERGTGNIASSIENRPCRPLADAQHHEPKRH